MPNPSPLRRLSDFMYLVYMDQCKQKIICLQTLQYIIHYDVANTQSLETVSYILKVPLSHQFPDWDHGYVYKPGSQDTDQAAKALVGIPNGLGIAWMLLQHEAQFGPRTIDQVTVFGSDYGELCIAWKIILL